MATIRKTIQIALAAMALVACVCAQSAQVQDASTPTRSFDPTAELQILRLVNEARADAGAQALVVDDDLTRAARAHTVAMAEHGELSHQFSNEPNLSQRLAAVNVHFSGAAENVALDVTPESAEDSLMHSPPHRKNLMDPSYNRIGVGVIREGDRIYVVQDFARRLDQPAPAQAEDVIAAHVSQLRQQRKLPQLQRRSDRNLSQTACSMAQQNRLDAHAAAAANTPQYVLAYRNAQADALPANAGRLINDSHVKSFSVGACYARTSAHPGGAYWVMMVFY